MGRVWALREARLSADARSLGAYAPARLFGEGREEGFPRLVVSAPPGTVRPLLASGFRLCSLARRCGRLLVRPSPRCEPGIRDEEVGASEL